MQQLNDVLCRAGIDPCTDVATAFEMQTKGEAFVALDQSDDEYLGDVPAMLEEELFMCSHSASG
jgi:hypothetical protein